VILSKYAEPGYTGRVGADEFAQILPGTDDDARSHVEKILPEIAGKIKQIYSEANVTISVAFSIYPFDFFDKTGVFSKMREMLAAGRTSTSRIVRVKVG
jgi:GGDEF domain-containing protein